jgi:hypothetical protein
MKENDREAQESTLEIEKAIEAFINFASAGEDEEAEFDGDSYILDLTRTPRKISRPFGFKNYKFDLCNYIGTLPLTKNKVKFLICGVDTTKNAIAFFRIKTDMEIEFDEEVISFNNVVRCLKNNIKNREYQVDVLRVEGEAKMEEIKRASNSNFFSQKLGNKNFKIEELTKKEE